MTVTTVNEAQSIRQELVALFERVAESHGPKREVELGERDEWLDDVVNDVIVELESEPSFFTEAARIALRAFYQTQIQSPAKRDVNAEISKITNGDDRSNGASKGKNADAVKNGLNAERIRQTGISTAEKRTLDETWSKPITVGRRRIIPNNMTVEDLQWMAEFYRAESDKTARIAERCEQAATAMLNSKSEKFADLPHEKRMEVYPFTTEL